MTYSNSQEIAYSQQHAHPFQKPPILTIENVTKQFSSATSPAVSSVSLTLNSGDLLALLGPSGCGKTTLLRLIAGFEQPQQGRIAIAQHTVADHKTSLPPEKRGVGMVFQDYALFPHLTVSQNIAFGLTAKPAQIAERVNQALALVGLEGMHNRYPHQLSGGQQQRVALARALAPHPSLVLLDEPLSNLDVQMRLQLRQELRTILKAAGASAIFVTHDQEEALSIADRVAVMRNGHLEQIGTPEQIYHEPASRFVADFVTQANFLVGQQQGSFWETAIGNFSIADTVNAQQFNSLEQVDIMIRQEDLLLHPHASGNFVVGDRQFLGREYRYTLHSATKQKLVARTSVDVAIAVGTPVKLTVATTALRVFPRSSRQHPRTALSYSSESGVA